ncbi:MAG TPA: peroxiredoxin-like family protein [Candidatus Dormibacteraeota bacterium]|nr:peroxiredoxin-like family protein [Candidatus Dormibacteraeota bacterium]
MRVRGRLDEIRARGADLAFVGNGTPAQARAFRARYAPEVEVYTDPGRDLYRAAGLRRSVAGTLSPRSLLAGLRDTLAGHLQTSVQGDPFQLGGLLVLAPGGEVRLVQRFREAADRPDLEAALAALGPDPS